MGPGEHRPHDDGYWARPWSTALFAGDLFEAVPFGDQPIALYAADESDGPRKHFLGEIAVGFGLLITPTCDMVDQRGGGPAHPYRTFVPVIPVSMLIEQTRASKNNMNLLRSRDAITPYMYLPALQTILDEAAVACLFRPALVSDQMLTEPPRRIAQLQPQARRHLKVKLAAYWGRVVVDPTELPLTERDEEHLAGEGWPPSVYDEPGGPAF